MSTSPEDSPQNNEHRIVDEVVYLASLVSDPHVIDPLLDTLRSVTSTIQSPETPLSGSDTKSLQRVRDEIIEHLMYHDALRAFTLGELQQRLAGDVGAGGQSRRPLHDLRGVGYVLAASMLNFILGIFVTAALPLQQRLLMGAMFAIVGLYVGVAWLTWSGLSGFSPKLRQAYTWICLGYIATGLAVMVVPLPLIFPDEPIFRYGIIIPLFLPSVICVYIGTQIFARAVNVQSWVCSPRIVFGVVSLAVLVAITIPHSHNEPSELYFRVSLASTFILSIMSSCNALLAYRISRNVASTYARAMRWFSLTMATLAVPLMAYAALIYFGGQVAGVRFIVLMASTSVTGVIMLVSAYTFKRSGG